MRILKRLLLALVAGAWVVPNVYAQIGLSFGSGVGQTTLTWTPSSTYTNGSAMTLANQRVYISTLQGGCNNLPNGGAIECVPVGDVSPADAAVVVDGLLNGTYYFWVTAFDGAGTESAASNEAVWVVDIVGNVLTPAAVTDLAAGS